MELTHDRRQAVSRTARTAVVDLLIHGIAAGSDPTGAVGRGVDAAMGRATAMATDLLPRPVEVRELSVSVPVVPGMTVRLAWASVGRLFRRALHVVLEGQAEGGRPNG
jgi:hypothetical protein